MIKNYKGLSAKEVLESRQRHGDNSLKRERIKSIPRRFFENLSDPIIKILMAALLCEVVFTLGRCNIVEVLGIVAAILIATCVSTLSEYGSEMAFKKLEAAAGAGKCRVIRDGQIGEILHSEVVVDDILLIGAGEQVPCDGKIVDGEVSVDQSALNGENTEAQKKVAPSGTWSLDNPGLIFKGSIVTDGEAVIRVLKVGENTYFGAVAKDVQAETRTSPLKLRLGKLASDISHIGYAVAFLVGFAYIFNNLFVDSGFVMSEVIKTLKNPKELFTIFIGALTLMITVIVVAVPEGLPMMITVVLSANMRRMIKDNVLVKKMVGIETAGSLNILFTDKTGTLTGGKLVCDRIIAAGESYKSAAQLHKNNVFYNELFICALYNTESKQTSEGAVGGNSTDRAILDFFDGRTIPSVKVKNKVPFKSELKYSKITLENGKTYIKGAAERIINCCKLRLNSDGSVVASSLEEEKRILSEALSRGERVVAVASYENGQESSMTFIALVILKDKVRAGVKKAVARVIRAGIQIVMVTGDNIDTAVCIGTECGFYKESAGHIALSSEQLSRMSDEEITEILPRLRVVARALPRDKSRLVRISQNMNLVVGMTGDGINDAPSLKLADVGFAMGSGTDIAKSAADIVLLDDSFNSIERTVLYGRTIFKSIKKFVTFQLIMNLAACGITLIGQIIGIDSPITIIQMLWVNIIMDTLGGLAFAAEPPLEYYMRENPKRRDEPILSKDMIWHIAFNGAFTLTLLVLFLRMDFFKNIYLSGGHMTAFYALFIFCGIFNCFSARCERLWIFHGVLKNRVFILIMSLISVIQILIVYYGGTLFRSTPLTVRELLSAVTLAMSVLVFDFARRVAVKLK